MASPEQKRTLVEKTMDVGFSAFSVATLPFWVITGVGAAAIGSWWLVGGAGLMATSDAVTIRDTFRKEKTPILNPSWWINKIRGRNRLGGNQRLASKTFN